MKKRIIMTLILVFTLLLGTAALIIGVSASNEDPAPPTLEWNGANLSFEENVHLLYSVGYDNLTAPENIRVLVWRESEGIQADKLVKGTEEYILSPLTYEVPGLPESSVAFKFTDIAAAEMTENIYTRAYYVVDGVEYYSPVLKYSVLQYAYNKLGYTGAGTESASLRELLHGMLTYGALAQKHFGVLTDRLASDPYFKIKAQGATLADGTDYGLFVAGTEDIVLTAQPTEALPYVKWTDETGKLLGYGTTYTTKADANKTITATLVAEESSFGAYKYVAVIGVDGAGTFWPDNTNTPYLDAIFANGSVNRAVEVPSPTSSGPSWTSILHGVPVENHGVNDNAFVEDATAFEGTDPEPWPLDSKYPSFLKVAKDNLPEGSKVAAIYGWDAFNNMIEDGAGIYKTSYASNNQAIKDEENTIMAVDYILENKPELFFFHLGNVDTVGHGSGFGTEAYFTAINTADEQIGRIYAAYEAAGILEDTLFIVTADHGGKGTGHGGLSDTERYTMFAAAGKTVAKDKTVSKTYNRDTAAIVLYALGINAPATYTAIVPDGIFTETISAERKIYNDPDSPRYHIPEATPEFDSKKSVTNFVENNLITYLPFDGTVNTVMGGVTSTYGEIDYVDGYFGEAVNLSDGHVILSNFKPGTDSFTIAMWMKTPTAHLETTVLSNKAKGQALTGIDFSLMRDTAAGWHQAKFNIGYDNKQAFNHKTYLPTDYHYGWTHVILVVDRANNTLTTIYDFGEFQSATFDGDLTSSTLSAYGLYIGKDANNNQNYPKVDLSIDEFMIFDGAFTRNDVNDLAEYFGKAPVIADDPTVLDNIETNADVYLSFDKSTLNKGTADVGVDAFGNPGYVEGITGEAINLNKAYLQLPEFKIGKGSFTASFWINPRDLSFAGNNLEYLPLITTQTKSAGFAEGFTLMLNTYHHTLYFNAANGYTAENGLPQVRTSHSIPFSADNEDQWTHIIFSLDKTAGAETVNIYVNFELVYSGKFTNIYNTSQAFDETLDSYTLTIGQYANGDYPVYLNAYLDDLILSKSAISASDVASLKAYYEPFLPEVEATPSVKDVLTTAPDVFLNFNNTVSNTGTDDSAIDLKGTASYTDGVDGSAMQLGGTYLQLPEYSLGTDSVSFAFWINPRDLSNAGANKEYVPIITTQSVYGGVKAGFTLMLETNNQFFMFNAGNGYTAENGLSKIRFNYCHNFPDGFLESWTHVAIVIDRTAGAETFKLYINFEEVYSAAFKNMYASEAYSPTLDAETLTIGQYSEGTFAAPPNAYIDDLIITKGVLSAADIEAMGAYYAALSAN